MCRLVWLVLVSPQLATVAGWLRNACCGCGVMVCAVVWLRGVAAKMGSFVAAENGGGVLGCLLG